MDARQALQLWREQDLLTADQAELLEASLDEAESLDKSNRIVTFLGVVGASLASLGLLLFIAAHWDGQSPARRLGLLFLGYLVVAGAAAASTWRGYQKTANSLWFFSSVAAGANIFLIGQVFQLPLNWWQGTLLWAIAALVTGLAEPSLPIGWLVVVLGVLTLGWVSVPSHRFFDQGAFLFSPSGILPLLPLIGMALIATSLLELGDLAFLRQPAQVIGIVFVSGPLVVSTFHPDAFGFFFQIDARPFHLIVAGLAVLVICVVALRRTSPVLKIGAGTIVVVSVAILPQIDSQAGRSLAADYSETVPWLYPTFDDQIFVFWLWGLFVFGLSLGVTIVSAQHNLRGLVNVGFICMAVLVLATYFGRIAGALPTAVAMLAGGVLVIVLALGLERKRRDLVTSERTFE